MRFSINIATFAVWTLLVAAQAPGATHYVDVNSLNPSTPFLTWDAAATSIQDAIDAAEAGDLVVVTNGVYGTGERPSFGVTNRVMVDKAVSVRSVNGPQATWIDGGGAARCVYLANGSSLAGFTLTNGFAGSFYSGGGVAFGDIGSDAVVSNCVIVGCSARYGGGAGTALSVGGYQPLGGSLLNCTIRSNSAGPSTFQFPGVGGGAYATTLINCALEGNSATGGPGGGTSSSRLTNCVLVGNTSTDAGGGAVHSLLINCTLVGNSGILNGGGTARSTLRNCIAYYNSSPDLADSSATYSCVASPFGEGNLTNAPGFLDTNNWAILRLQPGSPCIDAGDDASMTSPVDFEGKERRIGGAVDMGAYEWIDRPTHYVSLNSPNPTPPYLSWSTAATNIQDAIDAQWSGFPRRVRVTNGVYQTGGKAVGSYGWRNRVVIPSSMWIESVNGPQVTLIVGGTPAAGQMRCVYLGTAARLSGFTLTNGSSETRLYYFPEPAVNEGGGVYCPSIFFSSIVSNCVLTGNSAIAGGGAYGGSLIRCTLTGNSALDQGGGAQGSKLYDCTLATNSTGNSGYGGGGAYSCTLSNCVILGNTSPLGGGVRGGSLINCWLTGNVASDSFGYGGGAYQSYLVNCVLSGNLAEFGGGARDSTLLNCSVFENGRQNQTYGGGVHGGSHQNSSIIFNFGLYENFYEGSFQYCCTWPLPAGPGNTTDTSACIDGGNNDFVTSAIDVNGRPRIVGGRVDIGAAEFQGPFDDYLREYGLPTDGSADFLDLDGDGYNNWLEFIAGSVPTNAASLVRLIDVSRNNAAGVTVSWQSVSNRTYYLERATNLTNPVHFSLVASELGGEPGLTSYTDTTATGPGPYFYRVAVQTGQRPFAYATNEGAITITGYTGSGGAELIPATIHGLPVNAIADYAFFNKSSLVSITIPEGVTSIGTAAFQNCYNLNEVILPKSVTSIADATFLSCDSLTNLLLPDSVTNIGTSAFEYCINLTGLTIPNGVVHIGDSAFANCSALTTITLPDSVIDLGASAFLSCIGLTDVTLGNRLHSIPDQAFSNCTSLVSIIIPNGVGDIGDGAFGHCQTLGRVSFGSGVERIGNAAFSWCSSLSEIDLPDSVVTIDDWAFFVCQNLKRASIGNGVTSIGQHAFENCSQLTNAVLGTSVSSIGTSAFSGTILFSIQVPATVTNIGSGAFFGSSLTAIDVADSNQSYRSIEGVLLDGSGRSLIQCPAGKTGAYTVPSGVENIAANAFGEGHLTNITILNGVTNIGAYAFYVNRDLTRITIGSGVTYIGDGAFYYCDSLLGAYFLGNAPALGGPNVFVSVLGFALKNTVYYVPGTTGWGTTYGNRPTATWEP